MSNKVELTNSGSERLPGNSDSIYPEKAAPANCMIHDLAARRWSPRAFNENKPVEPRKIMTLLEAARWAPSCFNEQPWHFLVFDSTNTDALRRARACLVAFNAWAAKAPVLMLSVAREHFSNNGKPNRHAQHDLGMAAMNLVLEAVNQGLIAHQMGGFDVECARREFGIPAGYTPIAMIAIGYPGDIDKLPASLRSAETQGRQRNPIEAFAFSGKWKAPYKEG
jgi:nitroreductase